MADEPSYATPRINSRGAVAFTWPSAHTTFVVLLAWGGFAGAYGLAGRVLRSFKLGAAGGRRLFSQADFRGVLHRGPRGAGELEVWWRRGAEVTSGKLAMAEGWRNAGLSER